MRLSFRKPIFRKLFPRILKRVPPLPLILTRFILRSLPMKISRLLKRTFIEDLLGLAVRKQAESSLLRKDLRDKEVLLDTYRTRKSGKRIVLKD
jgi:hypothetical protein